ncbi:unnamed protein product [Rhizophagus irregularis]|nr:unnamed protein product [Rhizophagus irregularis]
MRNAQNIQILPTNSDSSIDNESIKEVEIAYFTKNLGVSTIIYLTVPMECPATSPDGVATVFSIQGWKNHMNTFNDIQYSIECQRIKHCSFADSDLINAEHCEVDFESDIFKQINKNNNENNEENYTYITFLSAQDSQCKFKQNEKWHRYIEIDIQLIYYANYSMKRLLRKKMQTNVLLLFQKVLELKNVLIFTIVMIVLCKNSR